MLSVLNKVLYDTLHESHKGVTNVQPSVLVHHNIGRVRHGTDFIPRYDMAEQTVFAVEHGCHVVQILPSVVPALVCHYTLLRSQPLVCIHPVCGCNLTCHTLVGYLKIQYAFFALHCRVAELDFYTCH